jgi:hypothetical protein
MKLLSKKILLISKSVLLFSLLFSGGARAQQLVSSDRFLLKVLDRTLTLQDLNYQLRNLKVLNCIYDDSMIISYFEAGFIQQLSTFLKSFPPQDSDAQKHLYAHADLLKKIRHFFKILRYSEDQRVKVSGDLNQLLKESIKTNKCDPEVLYKDTLKTNFLHLMEMELYLRSRYGGQLKQNSGRKFDVVRPSIDLFVESLDKQFSHEYYW